MFGFDDDPINGHDDGGEFARAMMHKPHSERPEPPADDAVEQFPRFADAVARRLKMGARSYSDEPASEKPLTMLCDELATELEDLAGWGALLWMRVQAMRAKLAAVERTEEP